MGSGFEAETGKFPPAMWYSTEGEHCPEDIDASGADAHVTVAEICPFLEVFGAPWIWCIFDILGLHGFYRDMCADDVGQLQRSGAEWRRQIGEFVFSR